MTRISASSKVTGIFWPLGLWYRPAASGAAIMRVRVSELWFVTTSNNTAFDCYDEEEWLYSKEEAEAARDEAIANKRNRRDDWIISPLADGISKACDDSASAAAYCD